jgi:hypothetical protein
MFVKDKMNWYRAQSFCMMEDADLTSSKTIFENEWILGRLFITNKTLNYNVLLHIIAQMGNEAQTIWLGAVAEENSEFQWINGNGMEKLEWINGKFTCFYFKTLLRRGRLWQHSRMYGIALQRRCSVVRQMEY